jgi:two-component system, OmpR family, phosphate regulon sensor histidine kinase PhoR
MKTDNKRKALVLACIIIVGLFSYIQFYLVLNTYQLTKDKYYAEVKKETSKIADLPVINALEDKAFENLKHSVILYSNNQLNKTSFLKTLKTLNDSVREEANVYLKKAFAKKAVLNGIRYKLQYDQIIVEANGNANVLMPLTDSPLIIIGSSFHTNNTILLNQASTVSLINVQISNEGDKTTSKTLRLSVRQSQYIDVSDWRTIVFERMAGIFILATILIVAVILLFYFVFSAMIKQKKIAQVKTDFANNITHELKTPLSSVNVILKSLEKKEIQQNQVAFNELLNTLTRQHIKINSIVDSVLESALSSDLNPEKSKIEISAYLKQYLGDLKLENHQLSSAIEDRKTYIFTNAASLEKALNNLVENAVKYSDVGTTITFKSYGTAHEYVIEVSDQGPGIPLQYQNNIFEKFFRIGGNNLHEVKGLGLGLYLSKQAIIQLGGTITLVSKPEQGCTFSIKLPL